MPDLRKLEASSRPLTGVGGRTRYSLWLDSNMIHHSGYLER
jgi:hypothetical protein